MLAFSTNRCSRISCSPLQHRPPVESHETSVGVSMLSPPSYSSDTLIEVVQLMFLSLGCVSVSSLLLSFRLLGELCGFRKWERAEIEPLLLSPHSISVIMVCGWDVCDSETSVWVESLRRFLFVGETQHFISNQFHWKIVLLFSFQTLENFFLLRRTNFIFSNHPSIF